MTAVLVDGLSMTYQVPVRGAGVRAAFASLVRRRWREVPAVRALSFALAPGEVVGFLGPNGAGKTTTLKLLSGVLHPSGGEARVLGHLPWRREEGLLRRIALVRGSRPLAVPPELTVLDALRFQRLVYEVPAADYARSLDELTALLDLGPLLPRQARALSLGERMRAGLAWALIYRPAVLFLDEPTIGLDVSAIALMRRFIADYARQTGATILLTSHYMADVESLCRRVILIDRGCLAYDGDLAALSARLAPYKLLTITLAGAAQADWRPFGEPVHLEDGRVQLRVPRDAVPAVTARLLAALPVADLAIAEPPLEHVVAQVYREGVGA